MSFFLQLSPLDMMLPTSGSNGMCDCVSCEIRKWKLLTCVTPWPVAHCSLPGSFVHGILQARILKSVAIPFSREIWISDPEIGSVSPALWVEKNGSPGGSESCNLRRIENTFQELNGLIPEISWVRMSLLNLNCSSRYLASLLAQSRDPLHWNYAFNARDQKGHNLRIQDFLINHFAFICAINHRLCIKFFLLLLYQITPNSVAYTTQIILQFHWSKV